jgi:hypothetical protein
MRYADLSPSTQLLLIGLLAVASASLFTRAIVFFYREKVGVRPIYPSAWSAAQCRALESFRLLVGLALIPLWGGLSFHPSIAANQLAVWIFGYDLYYCAADDK